MCGRYYVDDETAREIEKLVRQVDEKLKNQRKKRDIYPTQSSLVLLSRENQLQAEELTWGFPKYNKKGVIFNARSETALEKRMFRESVESRRCVIPAKGFYEWDHDKNKFSFEGKNEKILYIAGFYKLFSDAVRFVILTTNANATMIGVHDRMPLVLERNEIEDWLWRQERVAQILKKVPKELIKIGDCQQSFLEL